MVSPCQVWDCRNCCDTGNIPGEQSQPAAEHQPEDQPQPSSNQWHHLLLTSHSLAATSGTIYYLPATA